MAVTKRRKEKCFFNENSTVSIEVSVSFWIKMQYESQEMQNFRLLLILIGRLCKHLFKYCSEQN